MMSFDRMLIKALGRETAGGNTTAPVGNATTNLDAPADGHLGRRPSDTSGPTDWTRPLQLYRAAGSSRAAAGTDGDVEERRELYVWNRQANLAELRPAAGRDVGGSGQDTAIGGSGREKAMGRKGLRGGSEGDHLPAWEIDNYRWPAICRRIESQLDQRLEQLARRMLRDSEQHGRTIGITSCSRHEGRSSILLALARQLAWLTGDLAVVDADWQKPDLASLLQVQCEEGWEHALADDRHWSEYAIRSLREQMMLLPLLQPMTPSAMRVETLEQIVREVAQQHRLVLVDLGPLGDRAAVHPPCEQILFVRHAQQTTDELLQAAVAKARFAGLHVIGVIENFADSEQQSLARAA